MRDSIVALLAVLLTATGGCTRVTTNSTQFYLAQDYLPLPPAEREADPPAGNSRDCLAGPVRSHPRPGRDRFSAAILPGMVLSVMQTSYAATREDSAVPLTSSWQWTIPGDTRVTCAEDRGAVPAWQRSDLLHVRALLSGAQLPDGAVVERDKMVPGYFEQAMFAACKDASAVSLDCAENAFLGKFVLGLELNLRAQGSAEVSQPQSQPQPDTPFEPAVPSGVRADFGAPPSRPDVHTGYGAWYASLSGFRFPADLFKDGRQAELCRGPLKDDEGGDAASPARDADVCKFAVASLEWNAADAAFRMPGETLSQITRLTLLRSGDPLLLFQPQNYLDPLDLGNGDSCKGNPTCLLKSRTMQGFTDIQLLLPVTLGSGERRWLPIGMSVAAYEKANGVVVTKLRRSIDWLPATLTFDDAKAAAASKLAGADHRIDLRFLSPGARADTIGGVALRSSKADLLFAPGDIIFATRR